MKRVGKPNGEVTLLGTYDVNHNDHIVYYLGVDEGGKYYSVEDHEFNIGSAYSYYRDYNILEDSEVADLKSRIKAQATHNNEPYFEDPNSRLQKKTND